MSITRSLSFLDAAEDQTTPRRLVASAAPEGNHYIVEIEEKDGSTLLQINTSSMEGREVANQLSSLLQFAASQGREHELFGSSKRRQDLVVGESHAGKGDTWGANFGEPV